MCSQEYDVRPAGSPTIVELTGAICQTLRPIPRRIQNSGILAKSQFKLSPGDQADGAGSNEGNISTPASAASIRQLAATQPQGMFGERGHENSPVALEQEKECCQILIIDEVEWLDLDLGSMKQSSAMDGDSRVKPDDTPEFSASQWWSEAAQEAMFDGQRKRRALLDLPTSASLTVVDSDFPISSRPVSAESWPDGEAHVTSQSRTSSASVPIGKGERRSAPHQLPDMLRQQPLHPKTKKSVKSEVRSLTPRLPPLNWSFFR